jgi:archaellum component FlaC
MKDINQQLGGHADELNDHDKKLGSHADMLNAQTKSIGKLQERVDKLEE